MALTMTLEFSEDELDYFRTRMHHVRHRNEQRPPHEVAAAAVAAVERLRSSARSPFIRRRIDRVARLVAMLDDPEWQLPGLERGRVLDGLAYVADVEDLVPDDVPVLGLVDDAIMLELLLRELQHELDAYEEFDEYRRDEAARRDKPGVHRPVSREDWLASRREALHARIRERRDRDLARDGEAHRLITRF
jgi:uncharacterized membrane protein YkvA (DUF1232 family)